MCVSLSRYVYQSVHQSVQPFVCKAISHLWPLKCLSPNLLSFPVLIVF